MKPEHPWTCFGCEAFFLTFDNFQMHVASIRETVQYFCKMHNTHFESESDHSCRVPKRCAFCFEEVSHEFERHSCFHKFSDLDLATCDVCGRKFSKEFLDKHLRKVHRVRKRSRKCTKCRVKFDTEKEYYHHRYLYHFNKKKTNAICHICGKTYTSNTLTEHIKNIHKNNRKFKCEECGKAFATKYKLDRHMIVHSSEMKHQCSICSKMFKMLYSLQVHMKMHVNKVTFECVVCGKSFSTKQSRDNHLKKHGPG